MKVENILVQNRDYFVNIILKELCKNGIPYVYLENGNELHVGNYIFRFFDYDETLDILESIEEDVKNAYNEVGDLITYIDPENIETLFDERVNYYAQEWLGNKGIIYDRVFDDIKTLDNIYTTNGMRQVIYHMWEVVYGIPRVDFTEQPLIETNYSELELDKEKKLSRRYPTMCGEHDQLKIR